MGMRLFLLAVAITVWTSLPGRGEEPKIRAFDLKTIETLGQELYRRDELAGKGTDLMFEQRPESKREPLKGWVSILKDDASVVYFLREKEKLLTLAYTITFPRKGEPVVEDHVGEAVPEAVRARYRARRTALEAVPKLYTRPNIEVIDDPDGDGYLVYVLASTDQPNQMVVGGHYRVTVSADGLKAEQVDALSRSLLIVPTGKDAVPKGSEPVGVVVSHIVSDTPVESHVFVSLLHHTPVCVATMDGAVWNVEEGKIRKIKEPEEKKEKK
jgi:hypothetical protein